MKRIAASGALVALFFIPCIARGEIAEITRANSAAIAASSYTGTSTPGGMTPDGSFVVFTSEASNIVSGDTNNQEDVFLMDLSVTPHTVTRVSVSSAGQQANGMSVGASVSDDGRYVVFTSTATNLVLNDTNSIMDVFIHDTQTHQTSRLSVDENGNQLTVISDSSAISGNGRYAAFRTAAAVLSDGTGVSQIYVRDLQGGFAALVRASAIDGDNSNTGGNGASGYPSFNSDGSRIAFNSTSTNLIAGGTVAEVSHIYVRNLDSGSKQTLLVSRGNGGAGAIGNNHSSTPVLNSAGTRLSFVSQASNLVPGDVGGIQDAFVRDLLAQTTTRVSVSSEGIAGNGITYVASISPDGNFLLFCSAASNLAAGDTNGADDVFLRDLNEGTTSRVSVANGGDQSTASSWMQTHTLNTDASKILFYTNDKSIVSGDTSDPANWEIFMRDISAGTTSRLTETIARFEAEGTSGSPSISADGNLIAFTSNAPNIMAVPYTSNKRVFVRNRAASTTELITSGIGGAAVNNDCLKPVISANGRYVAFQSRASNLVAGDGNGIDDIFVYDRQTNAMTKMSSAAGGFDSDDVSETPSISATGRYIGFTSLATSLISGLSYDPGNAYVRDQQTGETIVVSADAEDRTGNGVSYTPLVSSDGEHAVFTSVATNLVGNDTNSSKDLFLKHLTGDLSIERLSVKTGGGQIPAGIEGPFSISPDARYAAFESTDAGIVASDSNGSSDIFLHDRNSGQTICISRTAGGVPGNAGSYAPSFTPDGLFVTFESDATNLVSGDTNNRKDAFVYSILSGTVERINVTGLGQQANDDSDTVVAANNRAYIAFASYASNLVSGDLNDMPDVFLATYDFCPADPNKSAPGICGCGTADTDSDGDGTADCQDGCDNDAAKIVPGVCGCGAVDVDSDGDGTLDCDDGCPNEAAKIAAGACGCGTSDVDSDSDGAADCNDRCPSDAAKIIAGTCGCGIADIDSDGDGTANCNDGCPNDGAKTVPGVCGCGSSEGDADQDGTADCNDSCSRDPKKTSVGICGCGLSDGDLNGNGQADCLDPGVSLVPALAKVKVNKKTVTMTLQAFNKVQYLVKITYPNKKVTTKLSKQHTLKLKSLPSGNYKVSYRIQAGSAVTRFSPTKKFKM